MDNVFFINDQLKKDFEERQRMAKKMRKKERRELYKRFSNNKRIMEECGIKPGAKNESKD